MSVERERLRAVVARLEAIDRERESVMRERDRALVAAKAAGASWADMRADTGMNPTAVSKALKRGRE